VIIENRGNAVSGMETITGMVEQQIKSVDVELGTGDMIGGTGAGTNYFTSALRERSYPHGYKKDFRIGPFRQGGYPTFKISAAVDKYNRYVEKNEANNSFMKTVASPKPDFVISDIYTMIGKGGRYYAYATVYNQGNGVSAVSAGTPPQSETVKPLTIILDDLKNIKTYTSVLTNREYGYRTKRNVRFGPLESPNLSGFQLRARADSANVFAETSEGNNITTRTARATKPDFIVSSATAKRLPNSAVYYLSVIIKNSGTGVLSEAARDNNNVYVTIRDLNNTDVENNQKGFNLKAREYPINYTEEIRYEIGTSYKSRNLLVSVDPGNAYAEASDLNNFKGFRNGYGYNYTANPALTY